MCRWLAYSGGPICLEEVLVKPEHSRIDQSMSSKSAETPTNADGFGVGWYGSRPTPGLYRSIRPAWNDFNLRDIAAQTDSPLFLAHVRASSLAAVQETNCHPFRHENWLFVHNGEIHGIEKFRKQLLMAVNDDLFPHILGSTDSEVMFYLAITFGLQTDPLGALARMAGFVEQVAGDHGVSEALWMTLGIADGTNLYAVRYASNGAAPTLYRSRDAEECFRRYPELRKLFCPMARLIASEPAGRYDDLWVEVGQSTCLRASNGKCETMPFKPIPPCEKRLMAPDLVAAI